MSKFYVCAGFDTYDPNTGYYTYRLDCIEWDESILGEWNGPKYTTKDECYQNSICSKNFSNEDLEPNNWCGISIESVNILSKTDESIEVEVILPETYKDTFIEYALYDIDDKLLNNFQTIAGPELEKSNIITIEYSSNVCSIAFRLLRPCPTGSESGSQSGSGSGSEESGSGSESGSEESGSGSGGETGVIDGSDNGDNIPVDNILLFDSSSWSELVTPMKSYIDSAATTWNNLIEYNQDVYNLYKTNNPDWNGLSLVHYVEFSDPDAGYIAACGPVNSVDIIDNDTSNIKINSITFQLYVNTYYYNNPLYNLSDEDWIGVMTHELGHALGIGTHWSTIFDYWLDGTKYVSSRQAYNTIIGDVSNNRNKIPLEDIGGEGTASAHWEDATRLASYPNSDGYSYPGCSFDIMVGSITPGNPKQISNLSLQYLNDIGYTVKSNPPIPAAIIQNLANSTIISNKINNICGTQAVCGCDTRHKIGTIDLTNKIYYIH